MESARQIQEEKEKGRERGIERDMEEREKEEERRMVELWQYGQSESVRVLNSANALTVTLRTVSAVSFELQKRLS